MKTQTALKTTLSDRLPMVISTLAKSALMTGLLAFSCLSQANTYPSFLTNDYCDGLVEQFVDNEMRKLSKYVNENFNPEFTGGIRNTVNFLNQQIEWLNECNSYLLDTEKSYVFYSEKSTDDIFAAMNALAKELQLVREGVEFPDETGVNNPHPFIKGRFETLANLVDQHHTRMLMKKQFQ